MKLAIKNNDKLSGTTELSDLDVNDGSIKYVTSENSHFYYFKNAESGDIKNTVNGGYWNKDRNVNIFYVVKDSYDFSGNSAENIKSIPFVHKYGKQSANDYKVYRDIIRDEINQKAKDLTISTENDPDTLDPDDGDKYLIGSDPVDSFSGKSGQIAEYTTGGTSDWTYYFKEELGFDQLNSTEKKIAVEHNVGTDKQHIDLVGQENFLSYDALYKERVSTARQKRLTITQSVCQIHLHEKSKIIIDQARNAITDYFLFGIEGTKEEFNTNEKEGISDYLYGRAGTSYEGNGLIDQNWILQEGLTMQDFVDKIYNILINGIY